MNEGRNTSDGNPKFILLISGKRKCGKDYFAERLRKSFSDISHVVMHISAPIKHEYAVKHNLSYDELLSSSSYKEKYREDMIRWSVEIRLKDPGYFIKAAVAMEEASKYGVWIVSDVRRKSDIRWYREHYPGLIATVRVSACLQTREKRGFVFTPNIDDAETECDLDLYQDWDYVLQNDEDGAAACEELAERLKIVCLQKLKSTEDVLQ